MINENIVQENKEITAYVPPKAKLEEKAAICLDLTCMRASFAPGVSEANNIYGFTDEQMKQNVSNIV